MASDNHGCYCYMYNNSQMNETEMKSLRMFLKQEKNDRRKQQRSLRYIMDDYVHIRTVVIIYHIQIQTHSRLPQTVNIFIDLFMR